MNLRKSHLIRFVCVLTVAGVCYGQPIIVDHTCVEILPNNSLTQIIPQTYLEQARQRKILFLHQSVGGNVMDGMVGNSTTYSLIKLDDDRYTIGRSANAAATWFDINSGIIDIAPNWSFNGSKALGFNDYVRNQGYGDPGRANVAFMKYCYIDWPAQTGLQQRWDEYRNTMAALENDFPNITFVYWTTAIPNNGGDVPQRQQFNDLLRDYCRENDKILFDLADIECHDPYGNISYNDFGDEGMWGGYAKDGQHLADYGQTRIATAMWWLLARIAGWQVGPTTMQVSSDTSVLGVDSTVEATITAKLYDGTNGLYITNEEADITFELTGPGALIGSTTVTTTDGVATIGYQAGASTGTATITASATGLSSAAVNIELIDNTAPSAPTNLLCDGLTNPQAIGDGCPDLTWTFNDANIPLGDSQNAYQVIVADNPSDINDCEGNVWDTGKVISSAGSANLCSQPLRAGIIYYWKVRTWDVSDEVSPYSAAGTFTLDFGLGYAAELDSGSGYIDLGNNSSLNLDSTNGFTIEMRVYRTQDDAECVLLEKFNSTNGGYRVVIDAGGYLYLRTMGGGKDRRANSTTARVTKGQWHHLACVRGENSDDGNVYIDGVEVGMNGLLNAPAVVTNSLRLGGPGIIVDELRISEGLRYTSNFTSPAVPFSSDGTTKGLWHFDERLGATAYDSSAYGNHGTITAPAGWAAGYYGAAAGPKTADMNEDGFVDAADYAMFALQWLRTGPALIADLDDDTAVNEVDLNAFTTEWLQP